MTKDMMNFRDLVEQATDADILREMIGFVAERLMESVVDTVTGAGYGEKDPARRVQRNGYRERGRLNYARQLFPRLSRATPHG